MLEAIALLERLSGAARRPSTSAREGRRLADERRRRRASRRARLAAATTPLEDGLARMWSWASARVAARMSDADLRSRSGAGGRLRPLLARARRALVASPLAGLLVGAVIGYRDLARRQPAVSRRPRRSISAQPYSASGNVQLQGRADEPEHRPPDRRSENAMQRAARGRARRSPATCGAASRRRRSRPAPRRTGADAARSITVQARRSGGSQRAPRTRSHARSSQRLAPFTNRRSTSSKQTHRRGRTGGRRDRAAGAELRRRRPRSGVRRPPRRRLDDELQAKQLLLQAEEVERPKVLTRAAAHEDDRAQPAKHGRRRGVPRAPRRACSRRSSGSRSCAAARG